MFRCSWSLPTARKRERTVSAERAKGKLRFMRIYLGAESGITCRYYLVFASKESVTSLTFNRN